jgi:hypothetical protein
MKKQEPNKRPSIFVENTELGALAMRAGFGTVGALAEKVERAHKTVTRVLRGETELPLAEKAIAEALGITVSKLLAMVHTPQQRKAA